MRGGTRGCGGGGSSPGARDRCALSPRPHGEVRPGSVARKLSTAPGSVARTAQSARREQPRWLGATAELGAAQTAHVGAAQAIQPGAAPDAELGTRREQASRTRRAQHSQARPEQPSRTQREHPSRTRFAKRHAPPLSPPHPTTEHTATPPRQPLHHQSAPAQQARHAPKRRPTAPHPARPRVAHGGCAARRPGARPGPHAGDSLRASSALTAAFRATLEHAPRPVSHAPAGLRPAGMPPDPVPLSGEARCPPSAGCDDQNHWRADREGGPTCA